MVKCRRSTPQNKCGERKVVGSEGRAELEKGIISQFFSPCLVLITSIIILFLSLDVIYGLIYAI